MKLFAWTGFVVLCAMSVGGTLAQTPPTPTSPPTTTPSTTPTYLSLVQQGFEVKDTMYLSPDASTRLEQTIVADTVMVTLQKGAVTATCWFTLAAWQQQAISTVTCNSLH